MSRYLHPLAGGLATLVIATFWLSTVISEVSGSVDAIVTVKTLIPWGLFVLIPALAVTGATGFRLGRGVVAPLIAAKRRRMPIIAANGILVLIPAAVFLACKASDGELDGVFYTVQAVELIAGAVNLALMGLNIRDGRRLTRR
ncbi:MAG: hypothetical protein NXI16_15250 [Alphaproteobacteria bacterium]|nr:hypothetical protein [Alphaproteobacteria bacterium]